MGRVAAGYSVNAPANRGIVSACYRGDVSGRVPRVRLVGPAMDRGNVVSLVAERGGVASATGRLFETDGLAALVAVMVTVGDWGAEPGAL